MKKDQFQKAKEDELDAFEKKKEQKPAKADTRKNEKTKDASEGSMLSDQPRSLWKPLTRPDCRLPMRR